MKRYKINTLAKNRPLIFFVLIIIFFPFKTEYIVYREAHGEGEIVRKTTSPFWWTYKPQAIEKNGVEFFIESSGGQVFWIPLATKKYKNDDLNSPKSYPPIGEEGDVLWKENE